ncbi:unnamed protein product [Calypogeia fissa]
MGSPCSGSRPRRDGRSLSRRQNRQNGLAVCPTVCPPVLLMGNLGILGCCLLHHLPQQENFCWVPSLNQVGTELNRIISIQLARDFQRRLL